MEGRLYKFARLVDAGSFTNASRELHISQPALSASIKKLERELHAELLIRGGRSLQVTDAGKLAYEAAKEFGVAGDNLITSMAILTNRQPVVAIGMIDSVAGALFASETSSDAIDQRAKLSIVVNNSRYLASAVERNELDMAFITDRPAYPKNSLIVTPLAVEPLILACHAADIQAAQRDIAAGRLPRFISYDRASATRRVIESALLHHNLVPEPTFYSTSPDVSLRLVLLRKGVAALPYALSKDYIANGTLSLMGNPRPIIIERPISVIKRRSKVLPAMLEHMTSQISQLFADYRAEAQALVGQQKRTA